MKNIIKILSLTFGAALLFTACTETMPEREPSPYADPNTQQVYFNTMADTSFELEPTAARKVTITLSRIQTASAITVPITISHNDDNAFVIPAYATFAAGQAQTTIDVTFENAPLGQNVSFELMIDDPAYYDPYHDFEDGASSIRIDVTIIKWNALGNGLFFDSWTFVDDDGIGYAATVTLEQRDDMPEVYRISYPYTTAFLQALGWANWAGGTTQNNIVFSVTEDGNVTWNGFWHTNLIYQGTAGNFIKAYLPSALSGTMAADDALSVVEYDEDGETILYFLLVPYLYIDGLGGFGLQDVYLGFPGFDLAGELEVEVYP